METNPQAAPQGGVQEAVSAVSEIGAFLETLVPVATIDVVDVNGAVHQCRTAISARRQILVLRMLTSIQAELTAATSVSGGSLASNVAGVAVALASRAEVVDALAEAFTTAHPQAVAAAVAGLPEAEREGATAADVFGVEELLCGLLPFFARAAGRVAGALMSMRARA